MPEESKYSDHKWVLKQLLAAQEADHDNRERAREAHPFVDARNGQWEQNWYNRSEGKPRYTFDLTNPIIDQVAGDMERSDFDIRIMPAGGKASMDTAKTYDGLIRNIENLSGATSIYNRAGREATVCGLDGWRVVQKYVDDDSFDQDLLIEKIGNYIDRVWHGPHEEPDASDAEYCFVLSGVDPEEFKERYPEANEASVGSDRTSNTYYYRQDMVMVGEFLYLKEQKRTLVKMSDGSVHEDNEELQSVIDELMEAGITEVGRRERKTHVVYSRLFSADGWLTEERETVFQNWIPVIPIYANFKLSEDKIIYWGVVEKLLDPQRVLNYSLSREIEEGALAPRAKWWMTPTQAEGFEEDHANMNTSADPVAYYNPDPLSPGPPQQNGGAMVNPGLRNITEAMRAIIGQSAGMFAANMGDNPGLQSGVAIDALQDRGDVGNNKYMVAREIAQRHTGRILVNAIPRVYEPGRQVRLLKEDGSHEMAIIGQPVMDQDTGRMVVLNDLSVGTYDVTCTSGPSFKNRQNETVKYISELGKIDHSIIEIAKDVLIGNIAAPGMDEVARRVRRQLFTAGVIPDEDLTPEEQQIRQQQAQQPPQEDPMMVAARAEELKGQADLADAQTRQAEVQGNIQIKIKELEVKQQELKVRAFEAETNRYEAEVKAAQAKADIQGKGANAAKALSEAEAQDIENDAALSGFNKILKGLSGG